MKHVTSLIIIFTAAIRMSALPLLHLGVDNGLSNGYVTDITEDSRGNIWVATEEGLNRWDGKRFHKYMPLPDCPTRN